MKLVKRLNDSGRLAAVMAAGLSLLHCASSERPPAQVVTNTPTSTANTNTPTATSQARGEWTMPPETRGGSEGGLSDGLARWSQSGAFAVRLQREATPLGGSPFAHLNQASLQNDSATVYSTARGGASKTLKCCADERCHVSTIADVAIAPNERLVVLGGPRLCVYSLPDLRLLSTYGSGGGGAAEEGAADLAISPRGSPLVQGSGGTMQILDIGKNGQLSSDPARTAPRLHLLEGARVAFNPEGWQIVSGGGVTGASRGSGMAIPSSERLSFWNVDNGAFDASLTGNAHPIARVAYSPSGRGLASLDKTGGLLLFPERRDAGLEVSREATSFAFLGDDRIAVGTTSGKAFVFDANGAPNQEIGDLREPIVNVVTDGDRAVAVQGASGRVIIWQSDRSMRRARVAGSIRGGLLLLRGAASLGAMPADGAPVWLEPGE